MTTTYIYTIYDQSNTPLYVGRTFNLNERLKHHRTQSPWYFTEAYKITWIEYNNSYPDAAKAENSTIYQLNPKYNVVSTKANNEKIKTNALARWRAKKAA